MCKMKSGPLHNTLSIKAHLCIEILPSYVEPAVEKTMYMYARMGSHVELAYK